MPLILRRRPARLAAVLVVCAIGTAACGDDDDDGASTSAATEVTATSVAAAGSTGPATTDVATTDVATTGDAPTGGATTPSAASAPSVPTAGGEGVTYTSPEGDYSAVFPAQPAEQRQDQPLPDGSTVELVIVGAEGADRFMATSRGQYPEGTVLDVPVALDGAQEQAIANVQGTLIDGQDVELQGRPGRQFSASFTSNGEAGTLLQRVYFDGPVIYQVLVTGAGELTFEDPEIAAFFDSFQFAGG